MPPLCTAVVYVLMDRAGRFGRGIVARGGGRSIARDAAPYWGGKVPADRSVFRALIQLEAGGFIHQVNSGRGQHASDYVVGNLARAHRPAGCRTASFASVALTPALTHESALRIRSADSVALTHESALRIQPADSGVSPTPLSIESGDPKGKGACGALSVSPTGDRRPDGHRGPTAAPGGRFAEGRGVDGHEPVAAEQLLAEGLVAIRAVLERSSR